MRLLVLDVEGTIFRPGVALPGARYASTIWQGIAEALGPSAELDEVATHRAWESGLYSSYVDWMKATIEIHRSHGLTRATFDEIVLAAEYNPHVVQVLSSLPRDRYVPVLISGGFKELAERAQRDIQIHHSFAACEYFFDNAGVLASYNLLPCDFSGKVDFIELMLEEYGLGPEDWVFVGDGANDVEIAAVAPFSVGYRPHDRLRGAVTVSIRDYRRLPELLLSGVNG